MRLTLEELNELKETFSDLLNSDAEDPEESIDPFTYVHVSEDNCLLLAIQLGSLRATVLLLKAGLEVNSKGDMGNTPLHYAFNIKNKQITDLLLSYGASESIKNEFGQLPTTYHQ